MEATVEGVIEEKEDFEQDAIEEWDDGDDFFDIIVI